MDWQVQEAKQRFSELLRRAHDEGPQMITRHGEEVAVMVDIQWYREKTSNGDELAIFLLDTPHADDLADAIDQVTATRPHDLGPDLGDLFTDATPSRP